MFFLQLLMDDPLRYFMWVVAVIISIVLHELGHGFAALWQGDPTPRLTGHITLDPVVHMGTTSLIFLFVFGFAFGAMPVNRANFRSRYGEALVAFAGPAVNLVLALIALTILGLWRGSAPDAAGGFAANMSEFLLLFGILNFVLLLFNLIPIPPLDGSTLLADFSPGYKRFAQDPNNQGVWMVAFIALFIFAGRVVFPAAADLTATYLRLFA